MTLSFPLHIYSWTKGFPPPKDFLIWWRGGGGAMFKRLNEKKYDFTKFEHQTLKQQKLLRGSVITDICYTLQ